MKARAGVVGQRRRQSLVSVTAILQNLLGEVVNAAGFRFLEKVGKGIWGNSTAGGKQSVGDTGVKEKEGDKKGR